MEHGRGNCEERRGNSASSGHDLIGEKRGKEEGRGGFISEVTGQRIIALNAQICGRDSRVGFHLGRTADVGGDVTFLIFLLLFPVKSKLEYLWF